MEHKTETELILTSDEVMVKQRVAFRPDSSGIHIFQFEFPYPILRIIAKDRFGKVPVLQLSATTIEIHPPHSLQRNKAYAVEFTMFIQLLPKYIAGIKIYTWGALDLFRVTLFTEPFQVLGFENLLQEENAWQYSGNLTRDITTHISKQRASRIEVGNSLDFFLTITYTMDCSAGGSIAALTSFGPVEMSHQQVELLTSDVLITTDENGMQRYVFNAPCEAGEVATVHLIWKINKSQPQHFDKNLGSTAALRTAINTTPNLQKLLAGTYWPVTHPQISEIAKKTRSYNSIFQIHKFLFEFTNRHLKYEENGVRYSPIQALEQRVGDCSEYADLLVTLHRAAGLPSRIKEGVIIDIENGEHVAEGHAWVEFLTTQGWAECDPTWGIELGVSCQHVGFYTQTLDKEQTAFEMSFSGPTPQVSYKITWDAAGKDSSR